MCQHDWQRAGRKGKCRRYVCGKCGKELLVEGEGLC